MEESEQGVGQVVRTKIKVFIDDHPYEFTKDDVTGLELKQRAGIPDSYSLYLRKPGGNEPIRNDEKVELHEGEHFFSRPPSNVS